MGSAWPRPGRSLSRSRRQWSSAAADDRRPVDEKADYQRWLAAQADDVKQAAIQIELEEAKSALSDDEVDEALGMSDDEAEHALAEELRVMKSRDPREFVRFLATLPAEERANLTAIVKKHGI